MFDGEAPLNHLGRLAWQVPSIIDALTPVTCMCAENLGEPDSRIVYVCVWIMPTQPPCPTLRGATRRRRIVFRRICDRLTEMVSDTFKPKWFY